MYLVGISRWDAGHGIQTSDITQISNTMEPVLASKNQN